MTKTLEKRVETLAHEIAKVELHLATARIPLQSDLKGIFGIFKDDPEFDEFVRLGAGYRRRLPKC